MYVFWVHHGENTYKHDLSTRTTNYPIKVFPVLQVDHL